MGSHNNKLDMWYVSNQQFFRPEKMPLIREKLAEVPEARLSLLYAVEMKDPATLLLVSIFFGYLGVDRFMLGHIGFGILKLLTGGGFLIFWLIEIITVQNRTRDVNFNNLMKVVDQFGAQNNA